MKTFLDLKFCLCFILLNFITIEFSNANWMNSEKTNSQSPQEIDNEAVSQKKDSLPDGVTQDWLNGLRDENGNRIIPENSYNNNNINNINNNTDINHEIPEDPEGDAMQRKVFNGLTTGSNFGWSVSNAGDVNGDGFDDIIVGASNYNSGTGRVYVYYGGLNMNTVADVILTGEGTNNSFGSSVSSAGDVNGDGYSDVIVGAYNYNSETGRAYIYYGGALMDNTADVRATGVSTGDKFGFSVSTAGDVNGDGYSDVIIGSPKSSSGLAVIFLGGAVIDTTLGIYLYGEYSNENFGFSVSTAGDLNSDGYSDVIVGAYGYSSNTGRAYIYSGSPYFISTVYIILEGESTSTNFGYSVSTAGDVNGDGYSDVIIGANAYNSFRGRAYIYFGGESSIQYSPDIIFEGEASNNYFGSSVSSAGDINGDGYSDIIVGADGYNSSTGRAFVYFGGVSMNTIADVRITGEASGNYFGFSVSTAGDVNGDGYSDIIVGAFGNSSGKGRVYLYDYFMKNEITPDMTMTGEASFNYFGQSVSTAGDVNGDGYSDVIIGAYNYSSGTGRAYIFFGGAIIDNTADVTMTGGATGNYFGRSVSTAGDINGDGYSDVIIGAYNYSSGTGRAYIFFGGAIPDNIADITMTGEASSNYFGNSVSTAGDVNGDGYSDMIVGAYGYSSNTGRAYIYFGGAIPDNVADITLTGETTTNNFGRSVSTAGDVNGDGYSDVIVGAYGYSSNTGRAYIYFGGAAMNITADVTMTGEANYDNFGFSVSTAGDVNGDGFSDVIVGSVGSGRAYIYFGGAAMNNTEDVTMTGEEGTLNEFGISVSSLGDVNGDGFSDVIIGNSGISTFLGKSYIYYGGASMNNTADVTMTGEAVNNSFGISVSTAGDMNGDGYSDIITGAYGFSSNTGKSYVYLGSAISAKPILNYVKDVPDDQGGFLKLKWTRSSFDVNGTDLITDYVVQRSYPPSGGNFSWENIAYIPATKESFYTYTATTPYDSTVNNSGTLFFRITARTSQPSQYWRSGILYGRSLDNIAPPMVSPFTAETSGPNVRTTWNRSTAPDLLNYILFRSNNYFIDPYTETPFATTSDSTYLDTNPLNEFYYYFIVAQDIHGNYSPVAVTPSPFISVTVNLTMFIEGFYHSGINTQVSDTVNVFLRNSISPYNIEDQTTAVVGSDGTVQMEFWQVTSGDFYIAVTHRNSIETWSSSPVSVFSGGSFDYDFTTASTQAFGNNMKQIDASPLRFGLFSGDENQDGFVNLSDIVNVNNKANVFASGYLTSDMNGDDITDLSDVVITSNNARAFVSKIVP